MSCDQAKPAGEGITFSKPAAIAYQQPVSIVETTN